MTHALTTERDTAEGQGLGPAAPNGVHPSPTPGKPKSTYHALIRLAPI